MHRYAMHENQIKFYRYKPTVKSIYQGKFCSVPWDTIQIDENGDVMLCGCQQHMPYVVGNIYDQALSEIWSGELAARVRQSVAESKFTYCSWTCPHLNILTDLPAVIPQVPGFPLIVKIDMDRSCNLKCSSCRSEIIIEKNSPRIEQQKKVYADIVAWAFNNPQHTVTVIPVASGEIFASHSGLAFLQSLVEYPLDNLKVRLTSNGTLIKKNQDLILNLRSIVTKWSISLDAATQSTYGIVRGGDWSALLQGLEWIKPWHGQALQLNFCIQKNNIDEIEAFADLADHYGAYIQYQKLMDWGHQPVEWIRANNVCDKSKDEYQTVLTSLDRVCKKYGHRVSLPPDLSRSVDALKESP